MSIIAERNVIGALLMSQDSISKVYNLLESQMFQNKLYGAIYLEYQKAFDNGYELNVPVLEQKLKHYEIPNLLEHIKDCIVQAETSATITTNANVIINDYKAQKLTDILSKVNVSASSINEQIQALKCTIEALQDNKSESIKSISEIVKENRDFYFKEREIAPINLGFDRLDNLLGGLEGGDMIVIGARPAVGKSAFVTQITANLAKQGKKVGFYNLEMQERQVYERFIVNISGIGLTRLRRATQFLGDEKQKFDNANNYLESTNNIMISTTGSKTVSEIKAECKHMSYDVIIIDYLQLLKAETTYRGNRAAEVGEISRAIKSMAMELNVPVVALSQLNRLSEGKSTKEPTMAELREAGNIEQDASVIMLLWNSDEKDNTIKGCKIEKNRQGECGKITLKFNGNTMNFTETDDFAMSASIEDENPFI